jgi:hypothetical protein
MHTSAVLSGLHEWPSVVRAAANTQPPSLPADPHTVLSCTRTEHRDMTGQRNISLVREGVKYGCSPDQVDG